MLTELSAELAKAHYDLLEVLVRVGRMPYVPGDVAVAALIELEYVKEVEGKYGGRWLEATGQGKCRYEDEGLLMAKFSVGQNVKVRIKRVKERFPSFPSTGDVAGTIRQVLPSGRIFSVDLHRPINSRGETCDLFHLYDLVEV